MILYYNFATTWPTCYFFPNPGCLNVKTIVRFEQHSSSSFGGSLFNTSMMFGIEKVKHSDPLHPRKASSYGHFYFDRWYLQKCTTDFLRCICAKARFGNPFFLRYMVGMFEDTNLAAIHGKRVLGGFLLSVWDFCFDRLEALGDVCLHRMAHFVKLSNDLRFRSENFVFAFEHKPKRERVMWVYWNASLRECYCVREENAILSAHLVFGCTCKGVVASSRAPKSASC